MMAKINSLLPRSVETSRISNRYSWKILRIFPGVSLVFFLLNPSLGIRAEQPDTVFEDSFEAICPTYYDDVDKDGYGDPSTSQKTCEGQPPETVLTGGDCNDRSKSINPGVADVPELTFLDSNCDGIDGDIEQSVFLKADGGNDEFDGLTPGTAVASLDVAYQRAVNQNRDWILASTGQISPVGDFQEGKHLAGGYNASDNWSRSVTFDSVVPVPSNGKLIDGWTIATTWQLLAVQSHSSTSGSSNAIRVRNTSSLLFDTVSLVSGNAGAGTNGLLGLKGLDGSNGSPGDDGVENSLGFCESNPDPLGGAGAGAESCGGHGGGRGGDPGHESDGGARGVAGRPGSFGGFAGNGGIREGASGQSGGNGDEGYRGDDGAGGLNFGSLDSYGVYSPSNGQRGSTGEGGEGGGGGGGGGGGSSFCDSWGGGGGGGGSGGCGGTGGSGGFGGHASIALFLSNSSITIRNSRIQTGLGGRGGTGGSGRLGGDGGLGGSGGALEDDSGPGGDGGDGGDGGNGGHGGGGGGGPSIGIICEGSSSLSQSANTFLLGEGGLGGNSSGNNGSNGSKQQIRGC